MKMKILGLLAVALLARPMAANAALLNFSLSDNSDPTNTIVFQLDSNPTPTVSSEFGGTDFDDISVSVNGEAELRYIVFYSDIFSGGLSISPILINQGGAQLYSGTAAAPIFAPGVWALRNFCTICTYRTDFTLTVSAVSAVSAVPEPGTLTLLGLGLVGMGYARRRKAS